MRYTHLCLSLIVVAILLIPGCSGAYSSDVQSTGDTTNDSFTVVLLSDTSIFNGSISYRVVGENKVIDANLYTLIAGAHLIIYGNSTYIVSFEFHIYDENGELDAEPYLFIGDESASDIELDPETSYELHLNVVLGAIQFTGSITCELILTISAVHNNCTHINSGNCATIEVQDDPVTELVDVDTGGEVEGDYIKTSTTQGGNPMVVISNSTNATGEGIADADGNINIVLNIPANTPFTIKIWNRESYNVRANISIENIMINGSATNHTYNNQKLGSGFARYFCYYKAHNSTYWSTTNLDNVRDNNGWFYSATGTVTITIDAHYDDGHGNKAQDVRLSIIFRDSINV